MPRLSVTYWVRIEKSDALTIIEWEQYLKKSYGYIFDALPGKVKQALLKSATE